jgi:hypothetical protein
MWKFLAGAVTGAAVVCAAVGYPSLSSTEPQWKVWVKQMHIPPNDSPYDLLVIQSRQEAPVVVRDIVVNGDPKCVNMDMGTYRPGTPVKLGEVYQFALGIHGFNACEPVRVVITTDRGETAYHFE